MKKFFYYLMAVMYILLGVNHFIKEDLYIGIMPHFIPESLHQFFVLLSGFFEILLGVFLLIPFTRIYAAWGIILLLIAVFPANIQMTVDYYHHQSTLAFLLTVLRLPLQLVLIWWAWLYTKRNFFNK